MAGNPFGHLIPGAQQAAPPPPGPYTVGIPQPRLPPAQTPADATIDRNRAAASAYDEPIARAQATKAEADAERARREVEIGIAAEAIEAERKASAFFIRAFGSNRDYEGTDTDARSWVGQRARDEAPDLTNWLNSDSRQVADSAQDEFIAASLRQDSGAAIPPEEMERQRRIYFPMPGDRAAVIEQKRRARERALEGLVNSAGRALRPEDRQAYDDWRGHGLPSGATEHGPGQLGGGGGDPDTFTDDQKAKIRAFAMTAQSAEELNTFAREISGGRLSLGNAGEVLEHWRKYGQLGDVADPLPPDISDQRGENAQATGMMSQAATAIPLGVPLVAGSRMLFGPETADAAFRGAADSATLGLSPRIAAGVETLASDGTYRDNLRRQRAIDDFDSENHFLARTSGQVAGGFALPTFGATGPVGLARIGAGYGAAYNFNSTDGSVADRLVSAGSGALIGGTAGLVLGGAAKFATRGGADPARGAATELIEAAQRQGVDVLPADVGGSMTRRFTGGIAQSPFGSGQVIRAAQNTENQVAARVAKIAEAEGTPVRQEVLGDTTRTAAQRYIDDTGQAGRRQYQAANDLAQGAQVRGQGAVQSLDANIAELSGNAETNAPLIAGLQRLRSDLSDPALVGPSSARAKNIDDIRNLRTSVRAEAQSEGLRGTDYQRRANDVLTALSDDIASQLPEEAAAAFRVADQTWAERLDTIDNTMNQLLGPRNERSAEMVANRLGQMARSDSARLRTFVNSLNDEEAGIVRGSLIDDLGRASSGQQNAEGTGFSLQTFLTNWDKLPERTRNILFRGESRAAMEDLARIAQGTRETRRFANTSNTGGAAGALSALGNYSTLGGLAVIENLTGRLLASPRFARWLARPQQDRGKALRGLSRIATREPALAPDINILRTVIENSSRAAASEDAQDAR